MDIKEIYHIHPSSPWGELVWERHALPWIPKKQKRAWQHDVC